jgi:hypothetical protein
MRGVAATSTRAWSGFRANGGEIVVLTDRGRVGAVAAIAALALTGCSQGSGGSTVAPSTPPTSASSAPSSSNDTTTRPQCGSLVAGGQALVDTVGRFFGGTATGEQVRAAATALVTAVDATRVTVGSATRARLDDAKAALNRMQTALQAQPPDLAATRAAANDTLTALRDAARICATDTATPTS